MKALFVLFCIFLTSISHSQTVFGKWKTIDDETGKTMAIVEIFEFKDKVYGKVIEIYDPKHRSRVCENCPGSDKNKKIQGLIVIKGLTHDGKEYSGGKILDPVSGRLYKSYITLEGADRLKVRGYIGIPLFGRTQIWERVK